MKVILPKNNQVICENLKLANDVFSRMVGLLGKKTFDTFDGLLLSPCAQIHSIGMKFKFDAVYLDNTYRVVALYKNIEKNRIMPYNIAVKNVLELPCGTIENKKLEIGDVFKISQE